MPKVETSQPKTSRRRQASARAWLVLLLALALATSGLLHALAGNYTAATATSSQDIAVFSAQDCGESCSQDHGGQPDGATCDMTNFCPLDAPLVASVSSAMPGAEPAESVLETAQFGLTQSPHVHPPKLFPNV